MTRRRYSVEELDESTCRRLLCRSPMGRVGFTDRALPRILPAYCTLHGDEVVLARRHGATLEIRQGAIVAFEVDTYDPITHEGWCVSLVGTSRVVTDKDEVAELDALDFAPWTSQEGSAYIGISMSLVHGRALSAVADV